MPTDPPYPPVLEAPTRADLARAARARAHRGNAGSRISAGARSVATVEHALLALAAVVPLLVVRPGVVTSDTKTYLYLDPGHFLRQIVSMWDPDVAMGTVTHQTIGYLFPMGPFFYLLSEVHLPLWVAQRLWLGGMMFAAGAGILYLCRTLDLDGPGRLVAAMAFMMSPYILQYAGRISVILLPWAGLGWMVAFTIKAVRGGGWKYPALFGVTMALISSINATAVLYVGLAPFLWLFYAILVEKEATWGNALKAGLRIVALSLLVSLWWIAGLEIEAAYGVNVLKFTETLPATTQTSSALEVLRGLGYWYFYGSDRDGPWTFSSVLYTQTIWVLALSFLLPVLAFLSAIFVRWRTRAYFVLLVLVGVVCSVGAYPYDHPTPVGGALKAFMSDTTAGLAIRSTDRATPLVLLGLAMLLGAGASALWRASSVAGLTTAIVLVGLAVANNSAIFLGDTIANQMTQPAKLPAYEQQMANHLNAIHPGTRVLAIPGDNFAANRYGDTVDTPQPALLTRPFAIHEEQIMGSMPTADMLYAFDEPIQEQTLNANALAPMASLMSAGDLLVENDTAYEHYGIPQPQAVARMLTPTPKGLSDPVSYGTPVPNVSDFSTLDEEDLSLPANPKPLEPLVSYTVDHPRKIERAESDTGAIVVAGNDSGLENMASTGMLDTKSAIYFSGTLDTEPGRLKTLMQHGAALVVTDTNRKQAFRWDSITDNTGYTETKAHKPSEDGPSDYPLELFPGAPASAKTTATYVGAVSVTASSYGNPVSYLPEDKAYGAVDNNPDSAWRTAGFVADPAGQWWQIRLHRPITADHLTLTQPLNGTNLRWITEVTLTFDGRHHVVEHLDKASRVAGGQVVRFPLRSFTTLRITIDRTTDDHAVNKASPVGFSSVQIPGVHVEEVIDMPTDLLDRAGTQSIHNRLTIVMDRRRVSPYPVRMDPEYTISRSFTLPTARTFSLSGEATISALVPDNVIDQLVGVTGNGITAYSSGRLPGSLTSTAGAALDGNPATAWQPGFTAAAQKGAWVEYNLANPITFDHMDLQIVADGRHSVPTSVQVSTESGSHTVKLPPIANSTVPGAVTTVPVTFPALTGSDIRITFPTVRDEDTVNYYAETPIAMPIGIAEVGIPGLRMPATPAVVPGTCQSNLITIDGTPISVRVVGSTATALANGELTIEPCGPDARGIHLSAGTHVIQTAIGHQVGWNVDQLVLDSARGGGPEPILPSSQPASSTVSALTSLPATQPGPAPTVVVTGQTSTEIHEEVHGARNPFELVLGQSVNAGWKAVATPDPGTPAGAHAIDLGTSHLVDGFANGWQATQSDLAALKGSNFKVTLYWTPQTRIWIALGLSTIGLVLCVVVGYLPERWRRAIAARWRRASVRTRLHRFVARYGPRRLRGSHRRGLHAQVRPEVWVAPSGASHASAGNAQVLTERASASGSRPTLSGPWNDRGDAISWWAAVLVGVIIGLIGTAVASPIAGVVAGVVSGFALGTARCGLARTVLLGGAAVLLAVAAAEVVASQIVHAIPESSDWPAAYNGDATLAWIAVALLAADGIVECVRLRTSRRARKAAAHDR